MNNTKTPYIKKGSTIFLQIVIMFIGIGAAALLIWEPQNEGRNVNATQSEIYLHDPFLALVYAGSIPFFIALYQAFKVLGYARKNKLFSGAAVKSLRIIKYCALTIIGFVAIEEFIIMLTHGNDDATGAVFVGFLIVVGSIIAATAAGFFARALQNAVDIKSENDLTV